MVDKSFIYRYDQASLQRRPFIRLFACGEDLSQEPAINPLPEEVASGKEPLRVVGAMTGGELGRQYREVKLIAPGWRIRQTAI